MALPEEGWCLKGFVSEGRTSPSIPAMPPEGFAVPDLIQTSTQPVGPIEHMTTGVWTNFLLPGDWVGFLAVRLRGMRAPKILLTSPKIFEFNAQVPGLGNGIPQCLGRCRLPLKRQSVGLSPARPHGDGTARGPADGACEPGFPLLCKHLEGWIWVFYGSKAFNRPFAADWQIDEVPWVRPRTTASPTASTCAAAGSPRSTSSWHGAPGETLGSFGPSS